MFPTLGTVSQFAFDQSIDRFSAKVEIQVPPNIAHVQLTLEKFGRAAHAPNLIEPEAGPASLGVYGPGHPDIKVGDEIRVMCFEKGRVAGIARGPIALYARFVFLDSGEKLGHSLYGCLLLPGGRVLNPQSYHSAFRIS